MVVSLSGKEIRLTPGHINIRINERSHQSKTTISAAIRFRIIQEIKLLYRKKHELNELLYKIHLECGTYSKEFYQQRLSRYE
jgi:hypothetical protein